MTLGSLALVLVGPVHISRTTKVSKELSLGKYVFPVYASLTLGITYFIKDSFCLKIPNQPTVIFLTLYILNAIVCQLRDLGTFETLIFPQILMLTLVAEKSLH